MSKRIHIAISVESLEKSIKEYTKKFELKPSYISSKYALFRTDILNFSINETNDSNEIGKLRHLGFEDEKCMNISQSIDCNGIVWEEFNYDLQEKEILEYYSDAKKYD